MSHQQSLNYEPRLDEILNDPIVRLIMDKDGAREADLRTLMMAVCRARFQGHIAREPLTDRSF